MTYDLAVAYRVYPKVAPPAFGLPLSDDKLRLAEACLRSFRESLGSLRVKVWALLDGCPPEYRELFFKYFDRRDLVLIPLEGIGNLRTFERQVDILLNQTEAELVYFAEDDYFYLPGQFRAITDFISAHDDVDFVTPYDHLDCYTLELHQRPKLLRVSADHHWRTAASTCLTFLTRKQVLKQTEGLFRTYGRKNSDASLWLSITKEGIRDPTMLARCVIASSWLAKVMAKSWIYGWRQILFGHKRQLWAPIPGIATHMDANALSPTINWRSLIEQQTVSDLPSAFVTVPSQKV